MIRVAQEMKQELNKKPKRNILKSVFYNMLLLIHFLKYLKNKIRQ